MTWKFVVSSQKRKTRPYYCTWEGKWVWWVGPTPLSPGPGLLWEEAGSPQVYSVRREGGMHIPCCARGLELKAWEDVGPNLVPPGQKDCSPLSYTQAHVPNTDSGSAEAACSLGGMFGSGNLSGSQGGPQVREAGWGLYHAGSSLNVEARKKRTSFHPDQLSTAWNLR